MEYVPVQLAERDPAFVAPERPPAAANPCEAATTAALLDLIDEIEATSSAPPPGTPLRVQWEAAYAYFLDRVERQASKVHLFVCQLLMDAHGMLTAPIHDETLAQVHYPSSRVAPGGIWLLVGKLPAEVNGKRRRDKE